MNIKQIFLLSFLGLGILTNVVRADVNYDPEAWAYNVFWDRLGGAASDAQLTKCLRDICQDDIAHWTNNTCFNEWDGANAFPKRMTDVNKCNVPAELAKYTNKMNLCNDKNCSPPSLTLANNMGVSYSMLVNVCSSIVSCPTQQNAKANAVMAPAPLVIRQNIKALRGNAPQAIRERGTNQNRQSRNNLQTGQPRVMPPLNQGKLPQRKTQHPGMMHIEPHHPAMLPPVNQGRTAPSVNAQHNHSGMKPVENQGRTTPPKMKPVPSYTHEVPSTVHPSMIHVNPQHPGMVPLEPHSLQAPKKP